MKRVATLLSILLAAALPLAAEEEATNLKEALSNGDPEVSFRYRFEYVDQDDFDKNANASTLRTTLSYRTQPWANFSLFLEAENVTDIGTEDQYNNAGADGLWNGVTDRPVVADPELTEVNQTYLRWQNGGTKVDLGRQEFNWGDQRYVGAVAWRQNHQSFDSLSLINQSLEEVKFSYLFISNVNRIFGDNEPMTSHLLTGKIDLPLGAVDLYGLYLDYDRSLGLSTSTFGLEWTGGQEFAGGWKLVWEAEYAQQSDAADNPNRIDTDYLHLMLGDVIDGNVTIKGGWEVLSGSPEDGQFRTPLATLHKFNGWADKFLATPPDGLEDLYLGVSGKAGHFGWGAIYHDFSAESASLDYGTEFDLLLTYKAPWGQGFGLKGAFYSADEFAVDTDKVWVYTTYKF